jgi:signal transduction histidine kinase/ligand-binding sensor domain-containing protein
MRGLQALYRDAPLADHRARRLSGHRRICHPVSIIGTGIGSKRPVDSSRPTFGIKKTFAAGSLPPIHRATVLVMLGVLLLVFCRDASALNPDIPMERLHHSQWSIPEGAPPRIKQMAQTADGFIWLATDAGLYQFDGLSFRRFTPKTNQALLSNLILALKALPDGSLWIGYSYGGASLLKDGELHHYPAGEGLPQGKAPRAFVVDLDGVTWVATWGGLFRLQGQHWARVGADAGYAGDRVFSLLLDQAGALWVADNNGVSVLKRGDARFQVIRRDSVAGGVRGLSLSTAGEVWLWSYNNGDVFCRYSSSGAETCGVSPGIYSVVSDAQGSMWFATMMGLRRIRQAGQLSSSELTQLMADAQPFGSLAQRLMLDHDGDIWLSGPDGLETLRENILQLASTPTGGLASGDGGGITLASYGRGVMQIGELHLENAAATPGAYRANDEPTIFIEPAGRMNRWASDGTKFSPVAVATIARDAVVLDRFEQASTTPIRLARDRSGTLWIAATQPVSLSRVDGQSVVNVPIPKLDDTAIIRGVGRDSSGAIWMGVEANSVAFYRMLDGVWTPYGGHVDVPAMALSAFLLDEKDRIWIGAIDNVAVLSSSGWRRFGPNDGLRIGMPKIIYGRGDQVWVGGESGLAGFTGDTFAPIVGLGGLPLIGITGIGQSDNGDLWLNGTDGITRIRKAQWQRALAEPRYEVSYTRFDFRDGLSGLALQGPYPSMTSSDDGRLWFATSAHLYWLDPARLATAASAPRAFIQTVQAEDTQYPDQTSLQLPVGTRRMRFTFSAPGVSIPERTRFRYRLVGLDPQWRDSEFRREASYTNLGPGHYRFEVSASNADAEWGDQTTGLSFYIMPALYQTTVFYLLCAVLVLSLLIALYLLRLRVVSARVRSEMMARHAEREHIARDLHDTLLQGVQGLILRVQALASGVPFTDPLRGKLESSLDIAQNVLREGRDRVSKMRFSLESRPSLEDALMSAANEFAMNDATRFEIKKSASRRLLKPSTQDEILQVGRESIGNAFRHAGASKIMLELSEKPDAFLMIVRDNGCGIPKSVLDCGGRDGHWGLRGMRERADRIGADLFIGIRAEGGTELRMRVPAAAAYL